MNDKHIDREVLPLIKADLFRGKTILILGPRQVGKTTLIRSLQHVITTPWLELNADNPADRELLSGINSSRARQLFAKGSVLFIDEAQRIENAGLSIKIIHDSCPDVQLIVTGSSAFYLSDKILEPLTGRKFTWRLFPLSCNELVRHTSLVEYTRTLEQRLIFGGYPDVINYAGAEKRILNELVADYLFKDVFMLKDVRKPEGIENLVKALAFQVGREVSYRELGTELRMDKETIERYIRLLEESMIIFRMGSFSRNLRNELKKSKKVYFYDNGVRNAIIQQFAPFGLRQDTGALWENFLLSERMKYNHYQGRLSTMYFWRTVSKQEIDYIEEHEGAISAFEFKWNTESKVRIPARFIEAYQPQETGIVTPANFLSFLGAAGGY